jgi:hypothetical protein
MKIKVTLMVFSGRPNPSWEIAGETGDTIIKEWMRLPAIASMRSPGSQLGYQGCRVEHGAGEFLILYNGYGYSFKKGKQIEQKLDVDRKTELKILRTAPPEFHDLIGSIIKV